MIGVRYNSAIIERMKPIKEPLASVSDHIKKQIKNDSSMYVLTIFRCRLYAKVDKQIMPNVITILPYDIGLLDVP